MSSKFIKIFIIQIVYLCLFPQGKLFGSNWVAVVDGYSTGAMFRESLQARGFKVAHVQSYKKIPPDLVGTFERDLYDKLIVFNAAKPQETLNTLKNLNIRALFTGSESGVELADYLNEELHFPSNGTELSHARRDKFLMHQTLIKKGIPSYARTLAKNYDEAITWISEHNISFPVISKPRSSAGGQYFRISKNPQDLKRNILETMGRIDLFGNKVEELLVEEYIEGREFAVNGVIKDGVEYITDIWEYNKLETSVGSLIYDFDRIISIDALEAKILIPYLQSVLSALGFKTGNFHAEIKLREGQPLLIEIAARPMGSFQPKIVRLATGTNQVELMIDSLLDPEKYAQQIKKTYQLLKHAVVVELMSHTSGWVTGLPVKNLFNSDQLKTYLSHKFGLKLGDWARPTVDLLATHPGTVFLLHEDPHQIFDDYQKIRRSEKLNGILTSKNPLVKCRQILRKLRKYS